MRQDERTRRTRIQDLRRRLVGDSIERKRLVDDLVTVVRADERAKTIETLRAVSPTAEDRA